MLRIGFGYGIIIGSLLSKIDAKTLLIIAGGLLGLAVVALIVMGLAKGVDCLIKKMKKKTPASVSKTPGPVNAIDVKNMV